MNDMQIRCFLTVADCRSVSKAAEALYLAQPSVSRYIGQMETELDVQLFIRQGRGMALTEAGEAWYQLCRRTWQDFRDLKLRYQKRQEAPALSLHYAVFPVWNIAGLLQKNEDALRAARPDLEIQLEILPPYMLIRNLLSGSVDLIFHVRYMLQELDLLEMLPLTDLPQIILYSASLPQAGKPDLCPADFQDLPFLFIQDSIMTETMIGRQMRSLEKRYGFRPAYRLLESPDAMTLALELGQGVALMDSWSRYRESPQLLGLPLDLPLPVVLAWRRDTQNPAVRIFAEHTAAWFREIPGNVSENPDSRIK